MNIIRREIWGAAYGLGWGYRTLPAAEAWLHHSGGGTPPAQTTTAERAIMRALDRIGYDRFGPHTGTDWDPPTRTGAGISYTYAVMPSGRAYEGHDVARAASHTTGHNTAGIGIVWPGDFTTARPTAAQIEGTAALLVHLKAIGVLRHARLTGGHRDTAFPTACPGNHAYAVINQINTRAAALETTPSPPLEDDMPLTDTDVQKVADAVWSKLMTRTDGQSGQVRADTLLRYTAQRSQIPTPAAIATAVANRLSIPTAATIAAAVASRVPTANQVAERVWAYRIPFAKGTTLHNTFGPSWRAGALLGQAALAWARRNQTTTQEGDDQ